MQIISIFIGFWLPIIILNSYGLFIHMAITVKSGFRHFIISHPFLCVCRPGQVHQFVPLAVVHAGHQIRCLGQLVYLPFQHLHGNGIIPVLIAQGEFHGHIGQFHRHFREVDMRGPSDKILHSVIHRKRDVLLARSDRNLAMFGEREVSGAVGQLQAVQPGYHFRSRQRDYILNQFFRIGQGIQYLFAHRCHDAFLFIFIQETAIFGDTVIFDVHQLVELYVLSFFIQQNDAQFLHLFTIGHIPCRCGECDIQLHYNGLRHTSIRIVKSGLFYGVLATAQQQGHPKNTPRQTAIQEIMNHCFSHCLLSVVSNFY